MKTYHSDSLYDSYRDYRDECYLANTKPVSFTEFKEGLEQDPRDFDIDEEFIQDCIERARDMNGG